MVRVKKGPVALRKSGTEGPKPLATKAVRREPRHRALATFAARRPPPKFDGPSTRERIDDLWATVLLYNTAQIRESDE